MKKVSLLIVALFAFGFFFSDTAQAASFGDLLIQLETSVNFSAQTSQWRSRRSGWISDVRSAGNDLSALKRLLIEFETNVNYSAQESNWSSRRGGWISGVNRASSIRSLGRLLIQVETSIKYSAQTSSWRNARSGWLSRVRSL